MNKTRLLVKKFILILSILFGLMSGLLNAVQGNRDSWQQPERVMEVIGVKPGMTIGEVGSGAVPERVS